MLAFELEVRLVMVKVLCVEFDNFGIPALVLGMARATGRVFQPSVIALARLHVRGYGLMAIEAKCGLGRPVAAYVALAAFVFDVRVVLDHCARHQG